MPERILTFNGFGGSNNRGDALRQWVQKFNVDVAIISELGNLKDDLRKLGRLVYADGDTPTDVGVLVVNGKVDDVETRRLTPFIHRGEPKPMLWRDRWYVRVRINDRVYYAIHGNAAISNNGQWNGTKGAQAWREAVGDLKARVRKDIEKGYAVRVGGDWNFPKSNNPPSNSPQDFYKDLGMNFIHDRVMWVGWDARYDRLVNKTITGIAPGADAHHNLLIALERKKDTPKKDPKKDDDQGKDQGGAGKQRYNIDLATTFIGTLSESQIKEELRDTVEARNPDLWLIQGTKGKLNLLREIKGYGVSATQGETTAVLYNPALFRPQPLTVHKGFTVASYIHRPSDTAVRVVNGWLARDEGPEFADVVTQMAKGYKVVFWGGRMDLDGDKNKKFKAAGLISAHGELKERNDTEDFLGTHKDDTRLSPKVATRFKVNGRNRISARYELSELRKPEGKDDGTGTPTEPEEEEEPKPVKNKFERDDGPSEDHSECCAGKSL